MADDHRSGILYRMLWDLLFDEEVEYMYLQAEKDTQIKLSIQINGVEVPYIFTNKAPFNDLLSIKYAGYCSIKNDLEKSYKLLDSYYGKFNDSLLDEVLWEHSILLIGKVFAKGEGRNVKLEVSNFSLDENMKSFLDDTIKIRNTHIAHHGITDLSHFMTVISLNNSQTSKGIFSIGVAMIRQSSTDDKGIENSKLLIKNLLQWTETKIEDLGQKILEKFNGMNIDDLYDKSIKPI